LTEQVKGDLSIQVTAW